MSPWIGFTTNLSAHPSTLPAFRYAWLEAPLDARLARVSDVPNWDDLHIWPAGRLFDLTGEYRWQRRTNDTLHAVLLLEANTLPAPFSEGLALTKVEEREASLILWGEWVDPQRDRQGNPDAGPRFYTNEIPRIQTYPLDLGQYHPAQATPRLLVWYYRDIHRQHGDFARCVDLCMHPMVKER
jgi:hypothetical protein